MFVGTAHGSMLLKVNQESCGACHVLQGSQLRIKQLSEMLMVLPNLEVVMPLHHAV